MRRSAFSVMNCEHVVFRNWRYYPKLSDKNTRTQDWPFDICLERALLLGRGWWQINFRKSWFGQKHFVFFTNRMSGNIFKEEFRMSMRTTLTLITLINSFLSSGEDLAGSMNTMNRIPFQWNVVYNIRNNPLLLQLILRELNFITLP